MVKMDKAKALEGALGQIERAFGKGSVMRLGQRPKVEADVIPTGSLGLDIALGIGGLPRGRVVEIYGPESSGKTTLALHAIAEAQKRGGTCAFIDAEHALDPGYAKKLGVDVDNLLIDLSRPETFARAVEGCRYVFHVAADYRLWVPDPAPMMTANVEGTRQLMLAAKAAGVEKIVYCSSVAALGLIGDGSIADENTPVQEHAVIGIYKRSKYRAEQEVLQLVRDQGLPAVIVNPSTPVGPRDIKPTPTGQMILDCAAGRMPAYVDTGVNIVHVDDVAEGHALALERGTVGEKYILGGENYLLGDRSAKNYLDMSGFSRAGLIQQLSSDAGDGYSVSDATIAVDSLTVDWNENAVRSAKQYLEMSGFSCKGLIQQLSSSAGEKYTVSQATYGARQAGACGEK